MAILNFFLYGDALKKQPASLYHFRFQKYGPSALQATNIFIILGLVLEKKDSRYLALPNHNGFGKVAEKREILGKMREKRKLKGEIVWKYYRGKSLRKSARNKKCEI